MDKKSKFQSVKFFRKVRDEQAALLAGKSPAEIIEFFAQAATRPARRASGRAKNSTRRST